MSDSIIQIKDVNKWYGDFQVLKDINLEVKAKEKIVVCGPSGSGKSTLIRCINRLEEHHSDFSSNLFNIFSIFRNFCPINYDISFLMFF